MSGGEAALGLARGTIALVAHDSRWAELFRAEALRLSPLLDPGVRLEHIGSTAVPGLEAKPILDLMVGLPPERPREALIEPLADLGYVHGDSDVIAGRLYFRRDDARGLRTHQLSVCWLDQPFWRDHLRFRDALRADASLAAQYAALKHVLALRHAGNRIAYSAAKSDFVEAVLAAGDGR